MYLNDVKEFGANNDIIGLAVLPSWIIGYKENSHILQQSLLEVGGGN